MVFIILFLLFSFHFALLDYKELFALESFSEKFNYFFSEGFFKARNLSNMTRSLAITGITAIGVVYVIISGEIDLSVGSLIALIGATVIVLDKFLGLPIFLVIPLVLLFGALLGTWNGWWIAYRKVPSFIVTLAGMMAFRGIATLVLGAKTEVPNSSFFKDFYNSYFLQDNVIGIILLIAVFGGLTLFSTFNSRRRKDQYGLPQATVGSDYTKVAFFIALFAFAVYVFNNYRGVPGVVVAMLVLAALMTWVGRNTVFGRHIYAMGGNYEATRLSGVNVKKTKMLVYTINGLMCAVAGIILVGKTGSATPNAGSWQELYTIAACFIGGTSMRGGIGTVFGAISGGLIVEILRSGMQQLGVDTSWQEVMIGAVLLLAVYVDIASKEGDFKKIGRYFSNITQAKS